MSAKPPYLLCEDGMPNSDRCVLIYSISYFGPDRWHPACWVKDGWAIDGLFFSKGEIGATHWMEMPTTPPDQEAI